MRATACQWTRARVFILNHISFDFVSSFAGETHKRATLWKNSICGYLLIFLDNSLVISHIKREIVHIFFEGETRNITQRQQVQHVYRVNKCHGSLFSHVQCFLSVQLQTE